MANSIPYRAVLLDLEGTLIDENGALPGAAETLLRLRRAGLALRFVTNITRRSRAALVSRLRSAGLEVETGELVTAVSAAAEWCRAAGRVRALVLLPEASHEDLVGLERIPLSAPLTPRNGDPHAANAGPGSDVAVIVGDLGPDWSYEALNASFRWLLEGAALVACQRNRYWRTSEGLALDAGPFVAALEYAARTEAVVVGKPSPVVFRAALADLSLEPREAVMLGDDAEVDVGGAIEAGLAGWLVKTGKYRPGDESRTRPWPECVLESVADLPAALGLE